MSVPPQNPHVPPSHAHLSLASPPSYSFHLWCSSLPTPSASTPTPCFFILMGPGPSPSLGRAFARSLLITSGQRQRPVSVVQPLNPLPSGPVFQVTASELGAPGPGSGTKQKGPTTHPGRGRGEGTQSPEPGRGGSTPLSRRAGGGDKSSDSREKARGNLIGARMTTDHNAAKARTRRFQRGS